MSALNVILRWLLGWWLVIYWRLQESVSPPNTPIGCCASCGGIRFTPGFAILTRFRVAGTRRWAVAREVAWVACPEVILVLKRRAPEAVEDIGRCA